MYTKYQILNVELATEWSKSRKIMKLDTLKLEDQDLYNDVLETLLEGESEAEVMHPDRLERDDRDHWILQIAHAAAADLLTLGKVQPETMVVMSSLPSTDFGEAVSYAVKKARKLNEVTIATEKQIDLDTISEEII
jgi:hypothetical protein